MTIDSVTHFPATDCGHDAIYTVIDRLSKFMYFITCKHTFKADELAYLFLANVVAYHGIPASIVSDHEPWFTSYFWRILISALGCKHFFLYSFPPEMDNLSERMHRSIE